MTIECQKKKTLSGKCLEAGQESVKFPPPERGGDVQSPEEFYKQLCPKEYQNIVFEWYPPKMVDNSLSLKNVEMEIFLGQVGRLRDFALVVIWGNTHTHSANLSGKSFVWVSWLEMLLELNPFSIISIESKIASIEPFFIPPLSAAVKSIRISFCISTCRFQYLLLPPQFYFKVLHFSTFLMHVASQFFFWTPIAWFVENNFQKCSNAIWDNARDCWEGLWSFLPNMLTISSSILNVVLHMENVPVEEES